MTVVGESTWVPRRTEGVLTAEVDGELVLMHPADFTYYGLSGTGVAVWERIDGERSVEGILTDLESAFSGDPATIRTEVLDFLGGLSSARLITSRSTR